MDIEPNVTKTPFMLTAVLCLPLLCLLPIGLSFAEDANVVAQLEKAITLNQEKRYADSQAILKGLADQGYVYAYYKLGELYSFNSKDNPFYNLQNAREALLVAAQQGFPTAQSALANIISRITNQQSEKTSDEKLGSFKEACQWQLKSAMQGTTLVGYDVARCYQSGDLSGEKDYKLAYAWNAVGEILVNGRAVYDLSSPKYHSNSMAAVFMRRTARLGSLSDWDIQEALLIAQDLVREIKQNMLQSLGKSYVDMKIPATKENN